MRLAGWLVPLALVVSTPLIGASPAQAATATESGQQWGTVKGISNGTLNIAPYNDKSDLRAFQLEGATPIHQGSGTIGQGGLAPGVNIRIDYSQATGQPAKATNIQVLPEKEVANAKAKAQADAPRMATNTPAVMRPVPGVTLDQPAKEALLKKASGSQPGRIVSSWDGKLVLDPYQQAAGDATLQLPAGAVVFQANNRVDTSRLTPGTDVRVFYKEKGSAKPEVIAVELLDSTQAKDLEKSERDVPKGK